MHVSTSPVDGGLRRCLALQTQPPHRPQSAHSHTHPFLPLIISALWHQTLPERGDQSKAPSLLSEANTITTTYVPFVSVPTSAQSNHTLTHAHLASYYQMVDLWSSICIFGDLWYSFLIFFFTLCYNRTGHAFPNRKSSTSNYSNY